MPADAWRDTPMPTLDELALYLGGSPTSFTGQLLQLMCKADYGNLARLAAAYPREAKALKTWQGADPAPTFGQLADLLSGD